MPPPPKLGRRLYNARMRRRASPGQRLRLLGLAGLGLAAGLAVMAALALPRLTGFAPAAGALEVSTRARVQVFFDRPMDPDAVAAAWQITPAVPGTLTWEDAGATLTFTPHQAWPATSAVTVSVTGGRSQLGLPLLGTATWSFTIGQERLVLLAGGAPNLAALSLAAGAQPIYLTAETYGVADFTVHPDGSVIVYAARRADGGADLRAVPAGGGAAQPVLACPEAACVSPVFSPDGLQLAYERQTPLATAGGDAGYGDPRLHVLTLATGADRTVGEAANPARWPRWAPDGRLSYYDALRQAVVVTDLATGAVTYIPSTSGEPGAFLADGQTYIFAEITYLDNAITLGETLAVTDNVDVEVAGFYSHLRRVTVATNVVTDLSGPGVVEDAAPVYSVAGDWLAFGRRPLAGLDWQPGRQLWLMRPDGTDPHPLTSAPDYHHSAFRWSPDGRRLAYMRYNVIDPNQPAEIWLINSDGTAARQLTTGGYLPEWLP